MIPATDKDLPDRRLLLEMALQTQRGVAFREQLLVHRAVRFVTDQAPLTRGFVFINVRAALNRVAAEARFVVAHQ